MSEIAHIADASAPSASDPLLGVIVDRLVETYRPVRVYLFGSAARGEAGPDSDYDLMVLVPDQTPAALRDSGRAYAALWRLARQRTCWSGRGPISRSACT